MDAPGTYVYTVIGAAPCANDQANVVVTENTAPDAGTDGTLNVCSNGAATDLFTQLGGAQAGGAWSFNGPPHSNTFTPGTDAAGVYTYTVVGTAPCPNDQATVTVDVSTLPDPGTNGNITVCASDAPFDLFTVLGGTPDIGGVGR